MSNFTGGSIPGTKRYKKEKKGLPSVTKKQKEADEKKAWLKKTRNSPAARSGAFTDDERWALHKKSRSKKVKPEPKKNIEKLKKNTASSSGRGAGRAAFQKTPNTYGKTQKKKKRKSAFADTTQWD
tara:strand:+ start:231 stop:608 length:378 start_codon:yes stop_codon:yes gene_type:complete